MTTSTPPTFESRAEFTGFDRFYEDKVHPYLLAREQDRIARVAKGKKYGLITATIISAIALLIGIRIGNFIVPLIAIPISGLIGWGVSYAMLTKLKGETKQFLMNNICTFLDWKFQEKGFTPPDLALYRTNRLLPSWDRVSFEDQMSSSVDGAEFTFCEAHLERKSRDKDGNTTWTTVFRGILLEVDFPRKFLGRTVVLRDAGIFNSKKKAGMKRVGLTSPKFEKIFEAYSTDQVESRYLLTPTFMQTLIDLETSVSGKKIRFGFLNDKLHVAVEAPNQFEAGSMYKPLTDTARTHKILGEISAVIDVIKSVSQDKQRKR